MCVICLSVTGLFHLALYPQGSHVSNMTGLPSFLKVNNNLLFVYILFSLCVDRQGCLYILVIVNNIAMNMRTQIALCNPDFSSFREVPKSETVESQCFHFNFFEELLY